MQWQESYDDAGRYSPWSITRWLITLGASIAQKDVKTIGIIDAFGFIKAPTAIKKKPGLAVGDIGAHHLMENLVEYPDITNIEQLKKIAQADLDLAQFRKDNFTIRTTGKTHDGNNAVRPGKAIILEDEDLITESDAGRSHTKKLEIKKINYTVNSSEAGEGGVPGGFVRYLTVKDVINLG